ncbi:MAG: hypothetical protein R2795_20765 [Saprospiraceae bacterium]
MHTVGIVHSIPLPLHLIIPFLPLEAVTINRIVRSPIHEHTVGVVVIRTQYISISYCDCVLPCCGIMAAFGRLLW